MSAQARERIDRTHVVAMVTDLLGARDPALVQEIVDRVRWRRLEAGDVLFEQGEKSDAAYFIVGGRLMVSVKSDDGPTGDTSVSRAMVSASPNSVVATSSASSDCSTMHRGRRPFVPSATPRSPR